MRPQFLAKLSIVGLLCMLALPLSAKKELPQTTKELDKAGYTVVDTTGADVLVIRPAIINLEVTAPDTMTPGMSATFVSSAGSMTLYAELYDSLTSDKIAEVLDSEEAGENGFGHVANSVTNRMAFEETLQGWATILVKRLDEARG